MKHNTKKELFKHSDYNLYDRLMFGTWAVLGIAYVTFLIIITIYGWPTFWQYTMK